MPDTQPRRPKPRKPPGRSVRITGRKLAGTAPSVVHSAYGLEPRDRVRPIVSMLASGDQQKKMLLHIAQPFVDDLRLVGILDPGVDLFHPPPQEVIEHMQRRGLAPAARSRLIHRIR